MLRRATNDQLADSVVVPQQRGRGLLLLSSAHRVSDCRIAQKEAAALHAAGYDVTVMGLERAVGALLPEGPNYIEYAAPGPRLRRFLLRLPWLLGFCLLHRYDAYHIHDPDLVLLGLVLKLFGRRVVYDVHESYPMVVLDRDWIPPLLRPLLARAWSRLESYFVRSADLTIAAHHSVARQFAMGEIVTVQNFPTMETSADTPGAANPMTQRPYRVLHHGDLTEQRGLLSMIDAIAEVEWPEEPALRLGGSLRPPLLQRIQSRPGFRRTAYLGWLNSQQLAGELSQARIGLVLLHPTNNYRRIRPNKLFEYMASGLPVIVSDFDHWRAVVEPAQCGLLVDPLDVDAIARALEYIFAHPDEAAEMGERGREAVRAQYNWQGERGKLLASYARLFSGAT
jgi:glycosyltransferase involved in cell wall biosynthesis